MTLCGVLKDILLVIASVMIWDVELSGLQLFGYSIALCGLIYYKLGAATLKAQFSDRNRQWAEYGVKHPVVRKLVTFGAVISLMIFVLVALAPTVGYDPKQAISAFKEGTPT